MTAGVPHLQSLNQKWISSKSYAIAQAEVMEVMQELLGEILQTA